MSFTAQEIEGACDKFVNVIDGNVPTSGSTAEIAEARQQADLFIVGATILAGMLIDIKRIADALETIADERRQVVR